LIKFIFFHGFGLLGAWDWSCCLLGQFPDPMDAFAVEGLFDLSVYCIYRLYSQPLIPYSSYILSILLDNLSLVLRGPFEVG